MMKHFLISWLIIFLLTACAPAQVNATPSQAAPTQNPTINNPYASQPGDERLQQAGVVLNSADLVFTSSNPVEAAVILSGDLPSPCHNLRAVVNPPGDQGNIVIELYSVVNSNSTCDPVFQAFQAKLTIGNLLPGHYTVWVNGIQAGQFDA